jgi:hypothetical protein
LVTFSCHFTRTKYKIFDVLFHIELWLIRKYKFWEGKKVHILHHLLFIPLFNIPLCSLQGHFRCCPSLAGCLESMDNRCSLLTDHRRQNDDIKDLLIVIFRLLDLNLNKKCWIWNPLVETNKLLFLRIPWSPCLHHSLPYKQEHIERLINDRKLNNQNLF